jgi:hypothetical protein
MKKVFLVILCFSIFLKADILEDKIHSIVGDKIFITNKNLIKFLFKDRKKFVHQDRLLMLPILQVLQEQGWLDIAFKKPQKLQVTFIINHDPIKSLKILNDTLRSLGYYYYFTKEAKYIQKHNKKSYIWTIELKTIYAIDPLHLAQKLLQNRIKLLDLQKQTHHKWIYTIDTKFASVYDTIYLEPNKPQKFVKPLKDYFFKIYEGSRLVINSHQLNHWHPYIVFYDKHLNILKIIKEDKIMKYYSINIPKNTNYIKVTDLYMLLNIKRGLKVTIRN